MSTSRPGSTPTTDTTGGSADGPSPVTLGASVAFVAGLAVTFPVLEVLGHHPEFFIARAAPTTDAVLVAVALGVVVPLVPAGLVAGVARLHRGAGVVVHGVLGTALVALFLHGIVARQVDAGVAVTGGTVAVAAALTIGFRHVRPAWSVVQWGAVVPVVAVALFALVWPTSRVVVGAGAVETAEAGVTDDVPVTVVLFDELSTASLLRGPDEIDAERFPNLASFAEDAVWYRNATTVSDGTTLAVPSVFTGRRSTREQLPIAADHPVSLFTLLGDSHDVRAVEPVTDLCPDEVCGQASPRPPTGPAGIATLTSDVSLIGAHVLLPSRMTEDLPRIDQAWGDFGRALEADPDAAPAMDGHDVVSRMESRIDESLVGDRRGDFDGVVTPGGEQPPAHLLHTLLPHVPYRLLPSGQAVYPTLLAGITAGAVWQDEWLARHAAAQYLLQLGFVDRMLGDLLADLEAAGAYEDGLVIVTADHGVSFEPGTTRRRISEDNLAQVASVPLLVKYPDRSGGRIDDRPAEITDIVPTVLEVLGATPPDGLDGSSLLAAPPPERTRTVDAFGPDPTFTVEEADPWPVARSYREVFGEGWDGVYRHGPHPGIIGERLADVAVSDGGRFIGTVDRLEEIRRADPGADPIVGVVSGGLGYSRDPGREQFVAVAFDDRIVAVGRTYERSSDSAPFLALVPPDAYAGGVDRVTLHAIEPGPDGPLLVPILMP